MFVIAAPTDIESASELVRALELNLSRNQDPVRWSIPAWDRNGCHWFAQAAKNSRHFQSGHLLGQALRNLSNAAIMREHKLANV